MKNGRLPERVGVGGYLFLRCADPHEIGIHRKSEVTKKRSGAAIEKHLEDSQFFTTNRKSVFFNSRLVQALMVHEY